MQFKGIAHKFGDNVNTDYIISGKYKFKTLNMKELSRHIMEDIRPNFYSEIKKGDFIVAGKNFGCGSSREQAPLAIIHSGISCIIAESFARIFYRNAINVGLPLVECDTNDIKEGDILEVSLPEGILKNHTQSSQISTSSLPSFMLKILQDGGLEEHFKKYGGFSL